MRPAFVVVAVAMACAAGFVALVHRAQALSELPALASPEGALLIWAVLSVALTGHELAHALTCKRCYKPPFSVEKATSILQNDAGTHFDPSVVDAFMRILPGILEIRERFQEQEEDG